MPIYDYLCTRCGPFEERRPMSESGLSVLCASCHTLAPRLPAAPRLNLMAANNRYAHTRNEKSAHEPDVVHRMIAPDGHAHAAGAEHQHHAHSHSHSHGQAHGHGRAASPSPRPWMLGH